MKKYISILLTLCLLLTTLIIPVTVSAQTFAGDTYYKFTFGEGGTAYGEYVSGQTATYKGTTYYPLMDQKPGSTTASVDTITDKATQQPVSTLRVEGSAGSRWKLVPLKANGAPFEVAPNSSYKVKIKAYIESKAKSSQLFAGLAAYKTNGASSHDGRTTSQGWYDGNFVASQAVHSPFLSGSIIGSSSADKVFTEFDSADDSQYFEVEKTIATGNNAVYDETNNAYKFVFDVIGSDATVENTNYFFLSGYGAGFTVDEVAYSDVIHIAEIEITKNPDSITFVNGNTSTNAVVEAGQVIEYPTLAHSRNYDHVWSLSSEEYIPAPATMPAGNITVYAVKSEIIGFENYKAIDFTDISNRIEVSSDKTYNGSKYSLKYENVEYKLAEEVTGGKPFSFDGSYHKYYFTYDEEKDKYDLVPAGSNPTWEEGKYYIQRDADQKEHSIDLWKLESNTNYKVSFKYYFDENSQCGLTLKPYSSAVNNIWDQAIFYGDGNATITKPETAGWQEGELYFATGTLTSATEYLYIQLVNTANDNTTPVKVYFDEFKLEVKVPNQVDDPNVEYGNDLVSYNTFENTSVVSDYGFVDYTNNYVIARVDKSYLKNGKKTLDEWSISGRNGFDATNISIANIGYESSYSLKFKQGSAESGNTVVYKIADIGNGLILEDKTTYRLSFYYRADGISDKDLTFSFVNAKDKENIAYINDSNTLKIAAEDVKSGWTYVSVDLTTDFDNIDSDMSGYAFCIPAIVINADINDTVRTVYMDNFAVCKPLGKSMASILTETATQRAGQQALRFYFDYNADENGNLLLSGDTIELSARGILISASSKNEELVIDNNKVIKSERTDNFDHCWKYENGVMTFSAHITGFGAADSRKIQVRGYVVLADGTVMYSPVSEYSLSDVKGYYDITANSTYYSLNDNDVISKVKFQGANEKLSDGYTFDWNGSALVVTAKTAGKMKVYLSGSKVASHYFTLYIDGELISDKLKAVAEAGGKYSVTFNVGEYPTVKEISFVRQPEACEGKSAAIHGFDMCGELMQTENNDILIEFLGDSITSGIGVHSTHHEDNSFNAHDGTNAYAFLSAQYLGVDYRIRSRSGIGLNKGWEVGNGDYSGPGIDWISTYNYENYWRPGTADNTYHEDRAANIVVIYLGTNDALSGRITADFDEKVKTIINLAKVHSPDAEIVWISGGMRNDYRSYVQTAFNELGGEEAGYYICDMPEEFAHKDGSGNYVNTGHHGHPGAEQQKVMAHTLIDFLKEKNLVD